MTWKEIKGFEGLYQISEFGDVKSLKKKSIRILKQGLVEIEFKEWLHPQMVIHHMYRLDSELYKSLL